MAEDTSVEFSVKELFLEVRSDLKEISAKLDTKAEALDLLAVAGRVTELEKGAQTQEALQEGARQARNARLAAWGALVASVTAIIGLVTLLAR